MKILVTGARGFIGKNLIVELRNKEHDVLEYDLDTPPALLDDYCREAEFVFHLAGVNRPKEQSAFMEGNFGFTSTLLDTLRKYNNRCPVVLSSSIQALLDNPYGSSKKAGENLLFSYSAETGAPVYVYRFANVFGKWCRPNYNSVIATFCHNIARDLPIQINDGKVLLKLIYIDDVVKALINALAGQVRKDADGYCYVEPVYSVALGSIAEQLYGFRQMKTDLSVPDMTDGFEKALYSTYLSYLPEEDFSYPLKMNCDARGSFTEIIRTPDRGQFSVNVTKSGITKGNHYHHTKNEKFVVVSGQAVIRFRKIGTDRIIEYPVSGEKIEVVDIPCGYTHHIANVGETDLITFMWSNESFDPNNPDTYFEEV